MKKMLCLIAVFAITVTMFLSGCNDQVDVEFVPSISYKNGPVISSAVMNGLNLDGCVVVTSLKDAAEKITDISQVDRDMLLNIYNQLMKAEMSIPVSNEYVVRELVDITWKDQGCTQAGHQHDDELKKEGVKAKIHFDLGIKAEDELVVFAYRNDQWVKVEIVEISKDGGVVCLFEDFCPVAFCVKN